MSDTDAIMKYLDERDQAITAKAYAEGLKDAATLRHHADQLARLVSAVRLEAMGGTPDLFAPDVGWDAWDEDAERALRSWREGPGATKGGGNG